MSPSPGEWPVFLIIHGHFYQPPRENPWINRIERQESAAPAHDWNERITSECYRANGFSRRLDGYGRIDTVINNFSHMSFNMGPTLASYLEDEQPDVYRRILTGDKQSACHYDGHGSAMAQVYNHVIMPLADKYDQDTQIKWGLADFEHRFGRKSKGMWLAETAINDKVVSALIKHGVEHVILSPNQAFKIRPLQKRPASSKSKTQKTKQRVSDENNQWSDVSHGGIDTSMGYRIVTDEGHLDVLFFDEGLSRAVSFEGLLKDASVFADKIYSRVENVSRSQLIHIATDGETFGHHHPYGDMCVAALMTEAAESRGITVTNPSQFLSRVPPQWEVVLKSGPNGEGTAWSCAHGVGRWYRDCGCTTGGQEGWTQEWRGPYREGLDHLNDELRRVFIKNSSAFFKDPWDARNDYIDVILGKYSKESKDKFFEKHLKTEANKQQRAELISLLEAQKFSMFMYTSCAWFFSEISGLEPVQNLKYAARAIELSNNFSDLDFEEILYCHLQRAASNMEMYRDGATVYRELVKSHAGDEQQIAFNTIVEKLCLKPKPEANSYLHFAGLNNLQSMSFSDRSKDCDSFEAVPQGFDEVQWGTFCLSNLFSDLETKHRFILFRGSNLELEGFVEDCPPDYDYEAESATFEKVFKGGGIESLYKMTEEFYRPTPFGLKQIYYDLREEVATAAVSGITKELATYSEKCFDRFSVLESAYVKMALPLPAELKRVFEGALELKLAKWIYNNSSDGIDYDFSLVQGAEIIRQARGFGFTLDEHNLLRWFTDKLVVLVKTLGLSTTDLVEVKKRVSLVTRLLDEAKEYKLEIDRQIPEEELYMIITNRVMDTAAALQRERLENHAFHKQSKVERERYELCLALFDLAERFNFSPKIRAKLLSPYERLLSNNPSMWP